MRGPTAEAVKRALGGFPTGAGYLCRCPVPTHGRGLGDRNPSMTVKDGRNGLVVHCFAGCDPRDILAAINTLDLAREAAAPRLIKPKKTTTADALALWSEGAPVKDTRAEKYISARGLPLPPASLRFHPAAAFSERTKFPALMAAIQAPTREIIGVQVTFLDRYRPRKAPVERPRRVIGNAIGGALRLGPVARHIGLAEGYETGHAAMIIKRRPVWCSLGSERLPLVRLPPEIHEVTIYADPDKAGLDAAKHFAEKNAHLLVHIEPPDSREDYAAILQRMPEAERSMLIRTLAQNLQMC